MTADIILYLLLQCSLGKVTRGTGGFQREQRADEFMSVEEIDARRTAVFESGTVDMLFH